MPQAIPILIAAAIEYGAYYVAIALVVASAVINNHQRKKADRKARDAYNNSLEDRLVMTATVNGPRSRVYGEVRNVDGILFKRTWGPDSRYYTLVVAHAGHECEAFVDLYFNDEVLSLVSDGAGGEWVQNDPWMRHPRLTEVETMTLVGTTASVVLPHTPLDGTVRCSFFINGESGSVLYEASVVGNTVTCLDVDPSHTEVLCMYSYIADIPKARVWKFLGTDSQDIGTSVLQARFPDLVNTPGFDDRFAGICCTVWEFEYDQDAFVAGVPNITARLRGAKVEDPRSPGTPPAWSRNGALIARDWSLYEHGGGCDASELVAVNFMAAANACDISTGFTTPEGVETLPLYQCDIVCPLDTQPDQHFAEIVESMAGKWGWSGGQLTLTAGVFRAPVANITPDWLSTADGLAVVPQPSVTDVVNVYRPSIADAARDHVLLPVPEVRSAAYIEADGQELVREVDLGGVTDNVHAQHVCGVLMRDSRDGLVVSLPCNMRAFALELLDVVTLTLPVLGFNAKLFEVIGWKFNVDSGVLLTLKETAASIFDPAGNFDNPNASPNSSLVLPWVVSPVEGLTVESGAALEDGTNQTRVQVRWDPITGENVRQSGQIEVQYADISQAPLVWVSAPPAQGSDTSVTIAGLLQGRYYIFQARAVNTLKVRSNWSPYVLHRVAAPPLVGTPWIEPGAATEVFIQDAATISQHGFDNYIEYTSTVDCQVILTVEALAEADQDAGPTGTVYNARMTFGAQIQTPAGVLVTNTVKTTNNTTIGNNPAIVRLNSLLVYDMPAGATWRFGTYSVGDFFPDLNWNFTEASTQLEVIKR